MAYTRVNWEDGSTSHNTPISAENLNKMDAGIAELDTNKANKSGGDFTGDISVNLSGDANKPYIATDYANGSIHINDKHGSAIDYKIGRVVQTHSGDTCQQVYPNKSGTFVVTDTDGNTDLGSNTIESGVTHSVAEGYSNTLDDNWTDGCHVEGFYNLVSGSTTHAEGHNNTATGDKSHAEGSGNTVSGQSAHAEGYTNTVTALYGHAEGGANTVSGEAAHCEGTNNTASGARAHAEGGGTESTADSSHAEGASTDAYGVASHAEGGNRNADGSGISSERTVTIDNETVSVLGPKAVGVCAHAEGVRTLAYGYTSHASGKDTDAIGNGSYTEGYQTTASGNYSHAEGWGTSTTTSGEASHAEGTATTASGIYSHAEGQHTTASGAAAHAEGTDTEASGAGAHAEGYRTVAGYNYQTAMGTYNDNKSTNLLEVGNGGMSGRANAMEVTTDGDLLIKNGGVSLHGLDENKEILGAKNLLPLNLENLKAINTSGSWSGNAYTLNGITFTVNMDSLGSVESITVQGNATGDCLFALCVSTYRSITDLKFIKTNIAYTFSQETTSSDIKFKFDSGGPWDYPQIAGNGEVDFTFNTAGNTYMPMLYVYNGTRTSRVTTKVMIRLASDPNPTYAPYAMGNQELTSNVNALNSNKEVLGAKNLLDDTNPKSLNHMEQVEGSNIYRSTTVTESTTRRMFLWYMKEDGTTFNYVKYASMGVVGKHTITIDMPDNAVGFSLQLRTSGPITDPIFGVNFLFNKKGKFKLSFEIVANDTTVEGGYVIKDFMVTLPSETNLTYRPYAMSNQELTQRLLALEARLN